MKTAGKRRLLAGFLAVVMFLCIPVIRAGATSDTKEKLDKAKQEKEATENQKNATETTIDNMEEAKTGLAGELAGLTTQLTEVSDNLETIENNIIAKNEEIAKTQEELEEARESEEWQYTCMKKRIQFMYENGQTSYLEALLSSRNISEFLNSADYIAQIQSYDRQKLTEYQDTVESIVNLEAQLEQEYTDLEALKSTVESNKATVAAMMRQKESELADISGDIEDAQSDADYYAAEIQAQEELIAAIKRAEAEKAAAGVEEHPYTGGAFRWPCPSSTRVTSDYGTRVSPMSGASSNHKGIDIGASAGADIIAAADGTVTAASYSSAAGNYVMIDHGGGLYTVYMHASSLLVSPGQTVSAGDVIAKVGSTGISTGSHLHFGVSLNGSYVSPWSYLGG